MKQRKDVFFSRRLQVPSVWRSDAGWQTVQMSTSNRYRPRKTSRDAFFQAEIGKTQFREQSAQGRTNGVDGKLCGRSRLCGNANRLRETKITRKK